MTIAISPADMILFAAVVDEAGFTRAARRLGLTKQTVSERLARLEARLGIRLLERTTRRLRVTDAGAEYHTRCAAIAALVDEANAQIQQTQAEPMGSLRVSAPVLYGRRFLAPVIASFLARFPKVRLELVLADRRVDLIEEGLDLAIRIGELDDSSYTARKLGEGHVYHVASPAFLAAHGLPRPAALSTARCIGIRPHETWSVGATRSKIAPVLVVNDLELACAAALDHVGIARLPSIVCGDAVRAGKLRVLFGAEAAQRRPVYVIFPSRQHLPAKVRLFSDALAALVDPMRPLDLTQPRGPRRAAAT
jgi:DNA-binding transcriptional LysR family regulator